MKSKSDKMVFDLMDALRSPILTHSQSWADTIPKRLIEKVPFARLIMLKKQVDYCSLLEAVIHIYTRTLTAPISHEWTEIYLNITCKVMQQYFNEDHWGKLKVKKDLNDYEKGLLMDLRRWIYRKRREILKQRLKKTEDKKIEPVKEKLVQLEFEF